ncbi:MAG: beta-lactamase family protein [Oscillospiraceae bacterium]|nr:beta-lactamase family protein [Oscillospiraceae bacterium]
MTNHLDAFERAVTSNPQDCIRGYTLLQHGKILRSTAWQPYQADDKVYVYSITKSFTATAIGICVDDGLLSVDDVVVDYFPQSRILAGDGRPDCPYVKQLTIHHLLTMNTGHHIEPEWPRHNGTSDDWAQAFFDAPLQSQPGTHFVYNSTASHMLSLILQKVTGRTLENFLQEKLFAPLEFSDITWQTDASGASLGGWGLMLRLEDLSKLGLLYLNAGVYNGKRLVSEDWIKQATTAHSDSGIFDPRPDWSQGYGYQFWRGQHGTFRGDGALGQYCIVFPEHDAVLALSGFVVDMQATLEHVYTHILPALAAPDIETNINNKVFSGEDGQIRLQFTNGTCILTMQMNDSAYTITSGREHWLTTPHKPLPFGTVYWTSGSDVASGGNVSACFHWDGDMLTIEWQHRNFPHFDRLVLRFDGNNLYLTCPANGMFGSTTLSMSFRLS